MKLNFNHRWLAGAAAWLMTFTVTAPLLHAEQYYGAWRTEFDPNIPISQRAYAIAMDPRGNVFVTGIAKTAGDIDQITTAKYDALDGHEVWRQTVNSLTNSSPRDITVDNNGDVIVTGSIYNGANDDIYTLKYNGATGFQNWARQKAGTGGGPDYGVRVLTDSQNQVIVTASSTGELNNNTTAADIVTLRYSTNGALMNLDSYTSSGNNADVPSGLFIDRTGGDDSIYICGYTTIGGAQLFYVRKLNSSFVFQWQDIVQTGGGGGATAIAVDANHNVFVTGTFASSTAGPYGFFTRSYTKTGGVRWSDTVAPTASDFTGKPVSIAIGPDQRPVVAGFLETDGDTQQAVLIKYENALANTPALQRYASVVDAGLNQGDTNVAKMVVDGASEPIVVGSTDTATNASDIFIAKYTADLSSRVFFSTFDGTQHFTDDGTGVAIDAYGNVGACGTAYKRVNNAGYQESVAFKFNRFIASTGDTFPSATEVSATTKFYAGSAPAISDNGAVAARVTLVTGKLVRSALLTQTAGGGSDFPAIVGGVAPGTDGNPLGAAVFLTVNDPLVSPNGKYAFYARLARVPVTQASGVWTNLSGTLKNVLQQGKPVPGLLGVNVVGPLSMSLHDTSLLALLKVSGPAAQSVVLLNLNSAGAGNVILRSGQTLNYGGVDYTVYAISTLVPPALSPGDGRFHSSSNLVVKVTLLKGKVLGPTVLYSVTYAGALTPLLASGGDASSVQSGTMWSLFGNPGVGPAGAHYVTLALLKAKAGVVSAANDAALVYSKDGASFAAFAREGAALTAPGLTAFSYLAFYDPVVNDAGNNKCNVAFYAVLKGAVATQNRAILFGDPTGTLQNVARTGFPATDAAGNDTPTLKFTGFSSLVLPAGPKAGPIFMGSIAGTGVTVKNNLGLWAVDTHGDLRRILRNGDKLGTRTVAGFVLLKAISTATTADRSFNATGAVSLQVVFTDKTQAMLTLPIP